jgi:hypothetical protein
MSRKSISISGILLWVSGSAFLGLVVLIFGTIIVGAFLSDEDDAKPIQGVDLRKWSTPLDPNTVEIVGDDLLVNGDFEGPNTAMWPSHKNRWKVVEGAGREDSRGLVSSPDPNTFWVVFGQDVNFTDLPEVLFVTGWVRTEGLARKAAYLYVACRSTEVPEYRVPYGQTGNASSERIGGTSAWTKLIIAAPIHPATTSISIVGRAEGPEGKAFLDEIHAYAAVRKAELPAQ